MLSGGSNASTSVTPAARTVTVHVSPCVKSVSGLSVYVVVPPVSTNVCAPDVVQLIVNDAPVAFTGSLNVMETFVFVSWFVAVSAGVVDDTDGAASTVN